MPKKDKDSKVSRRKTDVPVDPPIDTRGTVIDAEAFGSMEEDLDCGKPRSDILIVGIGASAGGLRAFKSFLEAMPSETGMGLVLVPHLDPKHESLMVELLSQRTTMPLREATQGTKVEADHVYVIPPNKYMEIREGYLYLVTPEDRPARRTAIDRFFESLALDQRECAVGIVLSGTGNHGTPGLKEIKLAGGMVMVQDLETAEYDSMPRSAIEAGLPDYVLSPQDMPAALISFAQHPYVTHPDPEKDDDLEPEMGRILSILRSRTRYDFRWYRKKMILRRVRRRMSLQRIDHPAAYLNFLRDSPNEIQALYKDMLIGVTGFFREPESFRILEEKVLPDLVSSWGGKRPIRVWVPGCATGEEPYSLAMLLVEQFQAISKPANLQIFATDIDLDALSRAREGIYPESIAGDLTPERLSRFFVPLDRHYQIRREIRDAVVFAPQNLASDPPFSRLDLISCRNLLIYLEFPMQQRIISLFHFALREGGYLFLGGSESVGRHGNLFEPISKKWRIFQKIKHARHHPGPPEIPIANVSYQPITVVEPEDGSHASLTEVMRRALLDGYGPASVLVNRNCEVLAFHGSTVDYLEFPSGEPSRDLITLLRSGLRSKVRAVLHQAFHTSAKVHTTAHVKRGSSYVPCRIEIAPVREAKDSGGLFLITFQDEGSGALGGPDAEAVAAMMRVDESSLFTQLENDLKTTREELQITIEELESSNEELKAANEEMMSMNEELQSANEELETSKEELQSLNEELTTVNNQLSEKVEELDTAYTDLNNLLTSSDIANVFLDREMRIRKFTPPTRKLFNVVSSDIGRPLADLSFRFHDSSLIDDAQKVLEELSASELEVQTEDGKVYIRRIMPYRSRANRIDGVTITFLDISDRKKQELKLSEALSGLEDQVSERTAALTMIRDVAMLASAAQSGEEILDACVRRLCDYQGWSAGFAYCAVGGDEHQDDGDEYLSPIVAWTEAANRDSDRLRNALASVPLIPGEHLTGRAWRTGEPQWTTDLTSDFPAPVVEAAKSLHLRSAYAYPIVDTPNVVALFLFMNKGVKEPALATVELLSSLGKQISLMVEREMLSRQLREMSAYDQVRLSQDLHDAIGQQLAGLSMSAEVISRNLAQAHSNEAPALAEVVSGLRETLQQIRLLARGLAEIPVGPGVLAIALEQLCANNPAVLHSSLACRNDVDRSVDIQDPDVAIHLYRIAQEAVHNAVNHSHGKMLQVSLKQDARNVIMEVKDDGIGLAKSLRPGMGLRTMRHRARLIGAHLDVHSEQGTRVTVRVPKGTGS
jgi:two-component system CheB/CheR fusion protein